jgi:hypothetical protein
MAAGRFWRSIMAATVPASLEANVRPVAPLRGKVSRISVIRSGEVSMVVRFGIDEARARGLTPGTLVELNVATDSEEVPK